MRQPPAIEALGVGGFRVAGVWRPGSLLVLQDEPRAWRPTSLADLRASDFDEVIAAGSAVVEFVLLGAGPVQALPPRTVLEALRAAGLGLEFMATESAARTHNFLSAQGRLFATALIAL
jgi:uncharacterized protein